MIYCNQLKKESRYYSKKTDEKKELQQLLKFNEEKQNQLPLTRESKAYWISKLKKKS